MNRNYADKFKYPGILAAPLLVAVLALGGCSTDKTGDREVQTVNQPQEADKNTTDRIGGKEIADQLLAGEYERLYAQFGESLKSVVTLKDFRAMGQSFTEGIASFKLLSSLRINGYESLVWNEPQGGKGLTAAIDGKGTIIGIQILDHPAHPETDAAYSKTKFNYPFQEDWLVYWGGHNRFLNYHYEHEQVRYAYDFLKVKNGYSYEGDPKLNTSYFAFDQPVLAPADGVVIAVTDGIPDNEPVGTMNEKQPAGNVVTIQHNSGEYSTLAHFKNGSIQVKKGDRVTAGQLLGKCGNSGNSSEPHIHFQVSAQSGKSMTTIPVSFKDGKKPIRADIVTGTNLNK
ncbi:M23 family metallopeptidase [Paenibacillus sp. YPG26]|uniref:M23 family metallopeptidase n=1 Tax=Paenibacillus sp. YPG26 TaxID=2878915 RepID=UPI00203FC5A0|nr:M23 family metallopeptidase [Paenibacillus sp. YPG26]USB33653.1 M23 family metallopeptidase [Paenibacillus sp. YPG26]